MGLPVYVYEDKLNPLLQRGVTGFAAGVMVAASIWSLFIPAMEQSESVGRLSFIPAAAGFTVMMVLDVALG